MSGPEVNVIDTTMNTHPALTAAALGPLALMLLALASAGFVSALSGRLWRLYCVFSSGALALAILAFLVPLPAVDAQGWLVSTRLGLGMALLVQLLGTVIGVFSARYLQGERGQRRFVAALSGVLASVHLLILADHWVPLILAWALVGFALQPLLCFYPDRPFAMLAAHKKRLADRLADGLLLLAAGLAWRSVGSGSLSALSAHSAAGALEPALQVSAVLLVLAVILRTALLPVHGWLIQVMEAPTPVSALLHAGVVNLGGYILIRFAPLLEQAELARWLLVFFGLGTAVLAGLVMLTRVSIKVRLAWSTVAQMGFMLLECGLGLYTLAALHLFGHSLYKAHAFLSASMTVRQTRLKFMRGKHRTAALSLWMAPIAAAGVVALLQSVLLPDAWPWWWSLALGLAWAPLLWLDVPLTRLDAGFLRRGVTGMLMVTGLTLLALFFHLLPLGVTDAPHHFLGVVALVGLAVLYVSMALLKTQPRVVEGWRRWSYAGFYVDEYYTRLTLWLWPARWTVDAPPATPPIPTVTNATRTTL